jgi:hypothetical protein
VLELIRDDGSSSDPEQIIRRRARDLIEEVGELWEGPPYCLETLASVRGYRVEEVDYLSDEHDACVTLTKMLVNANKAARRRRYSIGHEIGHTLFPDFAREVERGGPRWRRERDSQSEVELLCQIAASELLMPFKPFLRAMQEQGLSGGTLVSLSDLFDASLEATARRAVDLTDSRVVAVFLDKKHKPSEVALQQQVSFAFSDVASPPEKLRVAYSVASRGYNVFVPADKSIPETSVAYKVWSSASEGSPSPHLERAQEDWTSVGKIGVCLVDAVALPPHSDGRQPILCLVHPKEQAN